MQKPNLLTTILITAIVNAGFVYVSYLTAGKFKLSILHIIFGALPLVYYVKALKSKKLKQE